MGDLRSWVGSSFELVESKLHPTAAPAGDRGPDRPVERLLASHGVPVVGVVAPAGYGKRPCWPGPSAPHTGRVGFGGSARQRPAAPLTYLTVALDRVEPTAPGVVSGLAGPAPSIVGAVARLAAAMAAMTGPWPYP